MSDKVKVFWVEPSEWVEITITPEGKPSVSNRYLKEDGDRIWRNHTLERGAHGCMSPLYRLPDGTLCNSRELPPGALRDADYLHDSPELCGPDGLSLVVRLPNGHDWLIDSRASNCTRKEDKVHKCWCRHGDPRTGNLHVDKNGDTCAAGGGSIISGNYHGFLHHGYLVTC